MGDLGGASHPTPPHPVPALTHRLHGRSLTWDRNNTTAVGFQDTARAMQRWVGWEETAGGTFFRSHRAGGMDLDRPTGSRPGDRWI